MSLSLDIDSATAALISQLTLEDIAATAGNAAEDGPLSDAEFARRAQADEAKSMLRSLEDFAFARSIDHALELDQPALGILSIVESGVRDDHRYAEALEHGRELPEQSEYQRLLEDPQFPIASLDAPDAEPEVAEPEVPQPIPNNDIGTSNRARPLRVQCVICRDYLRSTTAFQAPCDHFYCPQCLSALATTCLSDESLFPLQCCKQVLPMDGPHGVYNQLDIRLRLSLRTKSLEFGTLSKDRVYCPRQTCSTFLGSSAELTENIVCPQCSTAVCVGCKQTAHPGDGCAENAALEEVKALARAESWQTCPGCAAIIELQQGCFHMTCRCRTEFCYVCAARWKNCTCPQWEEARLLDTAERRVEVEIGAGARIAAPDIFQQRVQQRVERLRYDHDCATGHRWRRRNGRGRCEECRYVLPEYLLACRSCGLAVCVRCARNRL
ncbi:hypothetical protein B0H10DRAFT_80264 [Mycena sp. CBHHK59/15]|nr:hypothetical protein B0H10DRAFT_80264 [Mycena sp. CBHHK59/15]